MYELGVSDGGILIGMTDEELGQSMGTMRRMADALEAEVVAVRVRRIPGLARRRSDLDRDQREQRRIPKRGTQTAEAEIKNRVRRMSIGLAFDDNAEGETTGETDESSDVLPSSFESRQGTWPQQETYKVAEVLIKRSFNDKPERAEVRVACLGGSESGKTTLLSYLLHGELDSGRGKARLKLLKSRLEIESGRSSTIASSTIYFDDQGTLLNLAVSQVGRVVPYGGLSSDTEDEHETEFRMREQSSKVISLIDTPGHRNYLRDTLVGLSGYNPDYVCFMVDCQSGMVDDSLRRLLELGINLQIPYFVILNKVDLATTEEGRERLRHTIHGLIRFLVQPGSLSTPLIIQNEQQAIDSVHQLVHNRGIPLFLVSCVSGENLSWLIRFLSLLPPRSKVDNRS
jgi:GTPase